MKNIFISTIFIVMSITSTAQKLFNPELLFDPAPYGFSHIAIAPANSKLVFVAGQGGEENTEGKLSDDFRTQLRHALQNIQIALNSQGLKMNAIVKVTTLVVEHDARKLQIIIDEFVRVWPDKNFPVNTLIPVPRLALDNMLVEVDAVAIAK